MRAKSRSTYYDVVYPWQRSPEVIKAFFKFGVFLVFITIVGMAILIGNNDKKQQESDKSDQAKVCSVKPVIYLDRDKK